MTNQQNKKPNILLVDDDPNYIKWFKNAFEEDFSIEALQHPNQISLKIELAKLESKDIELILLDFDFRGDPLGLKFLATENYKSVEKKHIPIVLITKHSPHIPLPIDYELTPNDLSNYGKTPQLYKQYFAYNEWRDFIKKNLKRKRVNIYINYDDEDKRMFDKHFYPTLRGIQKSYKNKNIDLNLYHHHCEEIAIGDDKAKWKLLYDQSNIVLHFVTINLLANDAQNLLFSNDKKNIPILAKPCNLEETALGKLYALPAENKFLYNGKWNENLCLEVTKGIIKIIDKFLNNPPAPPQK